MTGRFRESARRLLHSDFPIPAFMLGFIRALHHSGVLASEALALIYKWLVVAPVTRAICDRVGPGLRIERIPYIRGAGRVRIGEGVYLSGKIGIGFSSSSAGVTPCLSVGDHSFIGHDCTFNLRHEIRIGDHCLLAGGITVQDHDGHPLDPVRRRAGEPAPEESVAPVIIHDGAWVGRRSLILKGVTVGENAVIGAGSVVVSDVPANSIVAGNPARLIRYLDDREERQALLKEAADKGA